MLKYNNHSYFYYVILLSNIQYENSSFNFSLYFIFMEVKLIFKLFLFLIYFILRIYTINCKLYNKFQKIVENPWNLGGDDKILLDTKVDNFFKSVNTKGGVK